MAPAVPLIAAVAGSAAAGAIGTGIGASIAGALITTALNAIGGRLFAKKPQSAAFSQEAQGRALIIRSSIESHKIIYGQMRLSGPLVHVATTQNGAGAAKPAKANKMLHMVLPLAGHEVEEISTIYINDKAVELNGSGFVTTAPYSKTTSSTTSTTLNKFLDSSSRAKGVNTYTSQGAHQFVPGDKVEINTPNTTFNGTFTIVSTPTTTTFTTKSIYGDVSSGPTGGTLTVTRTTTTTTTSRFVRVLKMTGAEDQEANATMISEIPGWTTNHRLQGIAYIYVRLEYDPDVFPTGIPDVSAVVKGKKVYDPRDASTVWSDNAALCIRDYLSSDYGFGCDSSEINDTYVSAAANVCDESVALLAGGSQSRYTCNGVVDTAVAPLENLAGLITSLAGAVTYVQGQFRLHAGAYDTPESRGITISDLAGPIRLLPRTPRKELFNAVKGTYVDPNRNWQPTDFPPVTNSTYETQDGGERIPKDVELPFTNNSEAAQRIAKLLLEKGRQGIKAEMLLKHSAMTYAVYDVVRVTHATYGWSSKPFRILKWGVVPPTEDDPGGISVTLQEESSGSYDWNSGEENTQDSAPDTDLPNSLTVEPPGAITVTENLYITREGDGVKTKADVSWIASNDAFLSEYLVEYKRSNAGEWSPGGKTETTMMEIFDITPGDYDFRVKARNALGVSSEYTTTTKTMNGLLDPPVEPQNLTISTIGGLAILRWTKAYDLDVVIGGRVIFRHSPDTAREWYQSTTIGDGVAGSDTMAILPLKPGKYFAKTVDSSGISSLASASVTTEQATALAYANVDSLTEHPTFTGPKTNCYVRESGTLAMSGTGSFSDIPLVSAEPSIAAYGGIVATATYEFSGGIDLGSVMPVRVTSHVLADVFNPLDRIGSRTTNISTWELFSGTEAAEADAQVWIRKTNDDPAGTPAWTDWQRLDSGEFSARAFEAKLMLESFDPAYNISISELELTVDEVA